MTKLLIATKNEGKIREFTALLGDRFQCVSFLDSPYADEPIPDVDETGFDYRENAAMKARSYYGVFQVPLLADDSGVEVDVLGGEPGIFSARYGGLSLSWPERWAFLWDKLKAFPEDQWTARFRAVLCLITEERKPHFFEGVVEGKIVSGPKGDHGFGYDPIFYSSELGKTFGEASESEKASVSHRARAVAALLKSMKS